MEVQAPKGILDDFMKGIDASSFNYKRTLIGDSRFLSEEEKQNISKVQSELFRIQAELQSVAHERVIVDVVSRPVVNDIEHSREARLQAAKQDYNARRYGTEESKTKTSRAGGQSLSGSNPEDPIYIPPYVPPYSRGSQSSRYIPTRSVGGNMETGAVNNVSARAPGTVSLVPSMRTGYFPPEYKHLKTTPVDYSQPKDKAPKPRRRRKVVTFEPLAKSLESKFLATSAEMRRLKDRLAKTDSKFNKEKSRSMRKLKLIVDALEEKQVWKDHALMAAVEQLIQETLESFQDVVDEVDLLAILEEIVAQIPQPFIYEVPLPMQEPEHVVYHEPSPPPPVAPPVIRPTEEDYTVIHVHKKVAEDRQVTCEVQTDLPLDPPPAAPSHSSDNNQTTTIVERASGVEKDLLAILNTVVDSHKSALQGQQAIILALVQELAEEKDLHQQQAAAKEPTVVVIREEKKVEEVPPPPSPPPAIVELVKEDKETDTADLRDDASIVLAKEPVVAPPEPTDGETDNNSNYGYKYRTAFGEVVLGGRGLTGPYAVVPKMPLHEALARAGLDAAGEVIDSSGQTPAMVRRRATPLTMTLLHREPAVQSSPTPSPPEPAAVPTSHADLLTFATKLVEAMHPPAAAPTPTITKSEIVEAVNAGVKAGVKSALGYLENDKNDDYQRDRYFFDPRRRVYGGSRPSLQHQQQRGFPLHNMMTQHASPALSSSPQRKSGAAMRRVLQEAEKDPLGGGALARARDESRARTQALKRREDDEMRTSASLGDIDEEFHALYGDRRDLYRDSLDEEIRSENRNSSVFSSDLDDGEEEGGFAAPSSKRRQRQSAAALSDSTSSYVSSLAWNDPEPVSSMVGGAAGLRPIFSKVLGQQATQAVVARLEHQQQQQLYQSERRRQRPTPGVVHDSYDTALSDIQEVLMEKQRRPIVRSNEVDVDDDLGDDLGDDGREPLDSSADRSRPSRQHQSEYRSGHRPHRRAGGTGSDIRKGALLRVNHKVVSASRDSEFSDFRSSINSLDDRSRDQQSITSSSSNNSSDRRHRHVDRSDDRSHLSVDSSQSPFSVPRYEPRRRSRPAAVSMKAAVRRRAPESKTSLDQFSDTDIGQKVEEDGKDEDVIDDDDITEENRSQMVNSVSLQSSVQSFDTSHTSASSIDHFTALPIPLLSVGASARSRGQPRWKV